MHNISDAQRQDGYAVAFYKHSEGGPAVADIRARAEDLGIRVQFFESCYVGHRCMRLKKGSLRQYQKLLDEFGINYL